MSTPSSDITADVQVKNQTGNTVDRSVTNDSSIASLSGGSRQTSRSAPRVLASTDNLRNQRKTNDELHIPEPWMETVSPGKFERFQATIFNLVEQIISQPEYRNHRFTKKWIALKNRPKTPMQSKITWRNVKTILGLKDLHEYKDFLQQCPNLNNYIRIQPSMTSNRGFDFGLYDYSGITEENLSQANTDIEVESNEFESNKNAEAPTTPEISITITNIPAVTPKPTTARDDTEEQQSPTQPAQDTIFPPFTQYSDETDESYVNVETVNHEEANPKLTPRQTNTTAKNMTDPTADIQMANLDLPQDLELQTDEETVGFRHVHYCLYETVAVWMREENANKSPFYSKWRKAAFDGLTGLTEWDRVAKIFQLQYMREYVELMYECPKIREKYKLTWNIFDNSIRCKALELPVNAEVVHDISKLNVLHAKMKHMAFNFDSTMQHISTRITDINATLTGCERGIVDQLNRVSDRLANKVSHHMHSIADYTQSSMEKFNNHAASITDNSINAIKQMFATAEKTQSEKMATDFQRFESQFEHRVEQAIKRFESQFEHRMEQEIDQAIEQALQEINFTADEAAESLHDQTTHLLNKIQNTGKGSFKTEPAKPSKLFPNVDVDALNRDYAKSSVTREKDMEHHVRNTPTDTVEPTWGKDGPSTYHQPYSYHESLPTVDNNSVQKRVNIPYPGREQSYTWYLQIKSSLQQYGVYLISGDEFRKNKSLCPTEVLGIPVSTSRYNDMKNTLYQFLAQRTTIPPEYTDIRNIVNRNAVQTDGYRVLYDIMARIHPKLNPDNKFDAPKSADYSDIHEYSLFLTSYFMHEKYLGRNYTPREQANKFINGMDAQYKFAIGKLRGRMKLWSTTDPNIPEGLEMDNLPNMVDEYMEEDDTTPVIHRFERKGGRHDKDDKPRDKHVDTDNTLRKYVDIQCPLCKSHGHQKYQCDRMAIFLNLQEGIKLVDDKLKTKLQSNFADLDAKRRSKRVAKLRGTVRQLYQAGAYNEGEKLIEQVLGSSNGALVIDDSSDSDTSHSS